MKLGISSYCLDREMEQGKMTLHEVIDWAAKMGAECMELVPFAFRFDDKDTWKIDTQAIAQVKKHARDAGIELVNYSVLADFCKEGEALEIEIRRIEHEIDIAAELGLPRMRHDVSGFRRPQGENTLKDFERWMPVMAESAKYLTEYAKSRGVMTLIENHGFFANGCDRVERILRYDCPYYGGLSGSDFSDYIDEVSRIYVHVQTIYDRSLAVDDVGTLE